MFTLIKQWWDSQKKKQNKEEFAIGFMGVMRGYYIDRKTKEELTQMFRSTNAEDYVHFHRGVSEAFRIIKNAES